VRPRRAGNVKLAPSCEVSQENRSSGVDRASVRRDVASGDRGRCNKIQGAQDVRNPEVTSLASGRNADSSDTRYFLADACSTQTPTPVSETSVISHIGNADP